MRGGLVSLFIVIAIALGLESSRAEAAAQSRAQSKRSRAVKRRAPPPKVVAPQPEATPLVTREVEATPSRREASGSSTEALGQLGLAETERLHAIALEVPHHFERRAARERVTQLLQFWREAYGVVSEWRGDRVLMHGSVRGVAIDALFDVADGSVLAVARDPGWFWRARAHAYVEWMLRKYLHPTYQEPRDGW